MKPRFYFPILAAAATTFALPASAVTWTGATSGSWATGGNWTGTPPDNITAQAIVYDSTSAANLIQTLNASYTVTGITLTNPTGAVTVSNGTGTGNTLTIGSGGIDMSAATQNLTLSANLNIGANQTWTVNGGRTLTGIAGTTTSIGTGTGNIDMVQSGTGLATIVFNQNGNGTGWGGYSGNITVNSNVKVQSQGNAAAAFGSGALTLAGGTIAQRDGNWTWGNNINVTAASVIGNDSSNGLGRTLKLLGDLTSSNSSGLTFTNNVTGGTRTDDVGFILAGVNTSNYTTTTISANSRVRVGGNATATVAGDGYNAGNRGSLGTGDVTLSASTSELAFTRTDAHTVGNKITGSGTVVIGGNTTAMAGTSTQVVTLSGASDYTGATRVSRSRLNLTGTLTSSITVDNSGSISGSGSTTGLLTVAAGGKIALAGGATTTSLTANGVTFSGVSAPLDFLTDPISGTIYDVVTYSPGTLTNFANLASPMWRGTQANTGTKITFAASGATRTWAMATGTWDLNTTASFSEGDQKFLGGDHVVFNEPASNGIVTLSGTLKPASVTVTNTTNAYTFSGSGAIAGTGSLSKSGAGILTISGTNSYSGGTTLGTGILRVGNNSAIGTGSFALNGGTLSSDSGTLRTLANNLSIGGNVAFGDGTNGGQLVFDGTVNLQGSTRVITSVLGTQGARFNGVISNGGITKEGTGRITVANDTNSYTGATTINAGILAISLNALANSSSVSIGSAGTLAIGSNGTTTIKNLGGAAGSVILSSFNIVSDGTRTLQINQTSNGEFAGSISQGGGTRVISLIKTGSATLTLSGSANNTGSTSVNEGTLLVNGLGSTGSGAVTVDSGATLGGTGSLTGAVTVTGKIAPGSTGIESLNTGAVTWNGSAAAGGDTNWNFQLGSGNTTDLLDITGNFTKGTGSVFRFDFLGSNFTGVFDLVKWTGSTSFAAGNFSYENLGGGKTGTFTIVGTTLQFTAVPEPTSAVAGFLLGAGLLRRRRRLA